MQESTGEKGFVPVQERHTECDELSSYRSSNTNSETNYNCYYTSFIDMMSD